jgi:(S)-ureidoglycine-glyoxylate aminotransferase
MEAIAEAARRVSRADLRGAWRYLHHHGAAARRDRRDCAEVGALVYVDATATIGGMEIASDRWGADVVTGGLQKCLGGLRAARRSRFRRRLRRYPARRHDEKGIARDDIEDGIGAMIGSNYFDLAMIMDYWGPKRLNHHTEATTMLYGARECARVALGEGLPARFAAMPPPGVR